MRDSTNSQDDRDTDGNRRKRLVRAIIALALLAILSLCCWTLFWPVSESSNDPEGEFTRGSASAGGLTVRNVRSSVLTETMVSRKAADTVVTFDVIADGADVPFNIAFISLQLDAINVPPREGAEYRRWSRVPDMLAAGEPQEVQVVFGVPKGSMDATLTVRTSLLSDSGAPKVPFRLVTTGNTP